MRFAILSLSPVGALPLTVLSQDTDALAGDIELRFLQV